MRDLSAKIDSAYKNLTEIIEQAPTHKTSNLLERASKNKIEFDTYLSKFMQKQLVTSNYDDKSCGSIGKRSTIATSITSKSSRRSVKLLAAEAEYRAAQLKAKKAIERKEEETLIAKDEARLAMQKSQIARREAERELKVASVKLSVWKKSAVSNLHQVNICLRVNIYIRFNLCYLVNICLRFNLCYRVNIFLLRRLYPHT